MEPDSGKIHRKCYFSMEKKTQTDHFCKTSDYVGTSNAYIVLQVIYNCLQKPALLQMLTFV